MYMIEFVYKKLIRRYDQNILNSNYHKYFQSLLELQNFIYEEYFTQIFDQLKSKEKFDLEESLIALNRLTMNKLEQLIIQDIESNEQPMQFTTESQPQENQLPEQHSTKVSQLKYPLIDELSVEQTVSQPTTFKTVTFFSSDAALQAGRYIFKYNLNNIQSTSIDSLSVRCTMYNVDESNNKFYMIEPEYKQDSRITVTLPVGYYTTDSLLECLSTKMTSHSKTQHQYIAEKNQSKNKVYIKCLKSGLPANFGMSFSNNTSLSSLLGFTKGEYTNNSIYVSEDHPYPNIFDELYVKLYLGEKEVCRTSSSSKHFGYYNKFTLDYESLYGKTHSVNFQSEPFELAESTSSNIVSFEILSATKVPITRSLDFNLTMTIECIEDA